MQLISPTGWKRENQFVEALPRGREEEQQGNNSKIKNQRTSSVQATDLTANESPMIHIIVINIYSDYNEFREQWDDVQGHHQRRFRHWQELLGHQIFEGFLPWISSGYCWYDLNYYLKPNKLAILCSMLFVGALFFNIFNEFTPFGPQDRIDEKTSFLVFGLPGFLEDWTKLRNGCTSGHGSWYSSLPWWITICLWAIHLL